MKRAVNGTLFTIFLVGTIVTMIIVYGNINTTLSGAFVIGYVIFLLVYALYMLVMVFVRVWKLSWRDIRTRLIKFVIWFVLISALLYISNIFFMPKRNEVFNFGIPLGLSFGISFMDLAWSRRWKKK